MNLIERDQPPVRGRAQQARDAAPVPADCEPSAGPDVVPESSVPAHRRGCIRLLGERHQQAAQGRGQQALCTGPVQAGRGPGAGRGWGVDAVLLAAAVVCGNGKQQIHAELNSNLELCSEQTSK